MEIWEWLSSARKNYTQKSPLSSCRALPMSPGLPVSKLLVLALSKAILTIVFILWKVFASSFSPHISSSFLVASNIIPPAEKTKGMKRRLVRGLAWTARLSICSRYFVACRTIWRVIEVPAAVLVVVLVALLPRRV